MRIIIALILLFSAFNAGAQTSKKDIDACTKGQMTYNINERSETYVPVSSLNLKDIKNEFTIVVKPELKVDNVIMPDEDYHRQQSVKLDTSIFYLLHIGWRSFSPQKQAKIMEQDKAMHLRYADSLHRLNNIGHQTVYVVNNTDHDVAVQMQDWSYICVVEAIDNSKKWQPIQFWHFSGCGNSYHIKKFAPKTANYFIAPQIPAGNYITKLRYKLLSKDGFYYSNEFYGSINYCQFFEDNPRTDIYKAYKLETFKDITIGMSAY